MTSPKRSKQRHPADAYLKVLGDVVACGDASTFFEEVLVQPCRLIWVKVHSR